MIKITYMLKFPIKCLRFLLHKIITKLSYLLFVIKYRKYNSHNNTYPIRQFYLSNVVVGKRSYGRLDVRSFGKSAKEKLIIGNYVSIADDVKFLLGGNHQIYTFTTFPLKAIFTKKDLQIDAVSKGSIIIEDEVWIGFGTIILSGVKIGKGSIIAAGSVVTKDIASYAIAGGNPAKVIKFRFNEEVCDALQNLDLSDFDETIIQENIEEFYTYLDINQIEKLKKLKKITSND